MKRLFILCAVALASVACADRGPTVEISADDALGVAYDKSVELATAVAEAKSYEEFFTRYKALTDALLDNPRLLGFCYTQLYDIEQEQNGIYTYEDREPKVDVSRIREINSRKAAIED